MGGRIGLVLVAAGSSRRMGSLDKVWTTLGDRPVLEYSLRSLAPVADSVVVVVQKDRLASARARLTQEWPDVQVVAGGHERQVSVARGLIVLDDVETILVHDAARPFAKQAVVEAGLSKLSDYHAAVPAIPIPDTVKCIDAGGAVVETLDRSTLRLIQTPQLFRAASLRHAHAYARERGIRATDDAALVEQAGMTVCTFPGDARSFKITYPSDLDLARCLLHGAGCT